MICDNRSAPSGTDFLEVTHEEATTAALLEEASPVVKEAVGNRLSPPLGPPVEQVNELTNPGTPPAAVVAVNNWDDREGWATSQVDDVPALPPTPTKISQSHISANEDSATSSNNTYDNCPPQGGFYEDPHLSPPHSPPGYCSEREPVMVIHRVLIRS